ncbi:hypothetical protein [Brucella intermedia]|uniref:Putative repressor n=1 Tax=Brucella intermedia M86 TaxID=1234597 RepID=M5K5M2_9HYPH|nr:hypothetical protein [Brucella intermedia]ELT51201.1 putative repressor [Brucella intermedia M86]
MAKERVDLDLPDLSGFEARARPPAADPEEIRQVAETAGFKTRHADEPVPARAPAPIAGPGFDARSLRRTNRTAKLNIATSPENRERFWILAQAASIVSGEDVLVAMMDAFEREQGRGGR